MSNRDDSSKGAHQQTPSHKTWARWAQWTTRGTTCYDVVEDSTLGRKDAMLLTLAYRFLDSICRFHGVDCVSESSVLFRLSNLVIALLDDVADLDLAKHANLFLELVVRLQWSGTQFSGVPVSLSVLRQVVIDVLAEGKGNSFVVPTRPERQPSFEIDDI